MSSDIDYFKRIYPEWFPSPTTVDIIIGVLIMSLLFLIPYLYVRFIEDRLVSIARGRIIPFIRFRLRLEKLINFIDHILKIQIFRPKEKNLI